MLVNPEMYEGSACYLDSIIDNEDDNNSNHLHNLNHHHVMNMDHQIINWSTTPSHDHIQIENNNMMITPNTTPPHLLNLFQLPNNSISFSNPNHIDYDPLLPLNLPPQPPFFRELLHSLPNGYNLNGFGDMDMERDHHQGDGILKFGNDIVGKGKDTKHFATEKHRRQQLNDKFDALKNLVPNPTKADRASVVGDAIEYINELKRTVEELTILVERKRCSRGRMKKHKTEDDSTLDVESISTRPNGGGCGGGDDGGTHNSTLRSSWLHRKSNNTEVDVRIIDDEVTIKLVQQKKINCLLFVSKLFDELQLDLHHVGGGLIGDFYSYLFNTKICQGSSVYATAIANKLIQLVDTHYATSAYYPQVK